ncbi:unnamed protein product, partial [Vitis vinifera]
MTKRAAKQYLASFKTYLEERQKHESSSSLPQRTLALSVAQISTSPKSESCSTGISLTILVFLCLKNSSFSSPKRTNKPNKQPKELTPRARREPQPRRRSWCCSFSVPPTSPEHLRVSQPKPLQKFETLSKSGNSFPNSPQSARSGLGLVGRIDPRRILSPGRVSPIDSDPSGDLVHDILVDPSPVRSASPGSCNVVKEGENGAGVFDVRLNLKGKHGGSLVLELNSEVLSANSSVFADLISDYRKGCSGPAAKLCRIEVPEVEHLGVFRETIELMFEEDITKRLLKAGVYRSIDILEVSAGIMFTKGVLSCLKYLEAVPWSEEEEEKLRSVFERFKFDGATTKDILARLYPLDSGDSQGNLARQLVCL